MKKEGINITSIIYNVIIISSIIVALTSGFKLSD
ncbi:hypothetical protein SAMN04488577_3923 [Bacillus sp. cl95]|nr:hypothetical protein SAMN02799634_108109 [Bacillus sp. UNCCL13]SFQ90883.1 hypothetical protein SAMN04488577_3923 [Bacillus sp. cl95]